ncbi:MAG: copper homeostasis protein CutC [Gemmatimonadaceae bacterium]|nr:copper homeostasis protein CutC [Gemmatimonadaceae bacterium]
MSVLIEAAVDSYQRALQAERDRVHRIELCGPLADGGTTPSAGLIARCCDKLITSVYVLIRPRIGDFVYDDDELQIMLKDIAVAKELGADGVVVGSLTRDGDVNADHLAELVAMASPLRVGFHRAFDQLRDQDDALELLISMQVDHVLTSGGAPTALEGAARLHSLVERAGDRIRILAGGKIRAENAGALVRQSGVKDVHTGDWQGVAEAIAAR